MISIAKIGKQQNNSCGAFALAAIAKAHIKIPGTGTHNITYNPTPTSGKVNERTAAIDISKTPSEIALEIYKITGNLSTLYHYKPAPAPGTTQNEYNSISGMACVAKEFGLNMSVKLTTDISPANFPVYNDEKTYIQGLNFTVDENLLTYSLPATNYSQLIAVHATNSAGTPSALTPNHWIAMGDDKKYYDPATDTDGNNWDITQNKISTVNSTWILHFAGIWIDVN